MASKVRNRVRNVSHTTGCEVMICSGNVNVFLVSERL